MKSKAFILVEVAAGQVIKVLQLISKIPEVKMCYAITGQYDIIAYIEADNLTTVGKICVNQIQKIDGVLRTITCNVVEF